MGKHEAVIMQLVRTPSGRQRPLAERLNSRVLQTIRDIAARPRDEEEDDCESAIFEVEENRNTKRKK